MKDGVKQGREYTWDAAGRLSLVEPYVAGQIHGVAKQYDATGKVIGTYRLKHGTGFDLWRHRDGQGTVYVAEIHSLREGLPHGYEW